MDDSLQTVARVTVYRDQNVAMDLSVPSAGLWRASRDPAEGRHRGHAENKTDRNDARSIAQLVARAGSWGRRTIYGMGRPTVSSSDRWGGEPRLFERRALARPVQEKAAPER
jgi:hypothetical protein